jgi:Ca-activated chloride channel homolog
MLLKTGAVVGAAVVLLCTAAVPRQSVAKSRQAGGGALLVRDTRGEIALECPLKHTDVKAEISGPLARVHVVQQFENTASDTVEAVYVFPLPHDAAVDQMDIQVGERTIKGLIREREEARRIYDAARNAGKIAGLLDQERPNIFTQSVANIRPGEKVRVHISYVERVPYEAGTYSFTFPMVVGPRYIPGNAVGKQGGGWAADTDRVPDASKITPQVAPPGMRAGHDISIQVSVEAGLPVRGLRSKSHDVSVNGTAVALKQKATIPNKDFVLDYDVAGPEIADTVLTHRSGSGEGYFTLILQPPQRVAPAEITPKELVFVLDTSGSMSGFPIEKAKEAMKHALNGLNAQDRFNLITFAGETEILFPEPVPATAENLSRAQTFLAGRRGRGGTEMMKAIRAALDPTDSAKHVRVVCFMTDGYVGNEDEIISEVKRHPNARVFSFGIGQSVNRYLLDKMAEHGRGEVEYVMLNDDGSAAAKRFHERVRSPLLTDVKIAWNGLPVSEVFPARVPDLFAAKPLVISGKYAGPARGTIRLTGTAAGKPFARDIRVDLPAAEAKHDVLAKLWARTKVDHLMHESGTKQEITQLGLAYRLMTPYTSFVAVEDKVVNEGGKSRRVEVPVEMPEGVSHEGVFGADAMAFAPMNGIAQMKMPVASTPAFLSRSAGMPAPAEMRVQQAVERGTKLHPSLVGLTGTQKVDVQVWVTLRTEQNLAALKQLGFELVSTTPAQAKLYVGRIEAGKLAELARLPFVTYVGPVK